MRAKPVNVSKHDNRQLKIGVALTQQLEQQMAEQAAMSLITAGIRTEIRNLLVQVAFSGVVVGNIGRRLS